MFYEIAKDEHASLDLMNKKQDRFCAIGLNRNEGTELRWRRLSVVHQRDNFSIVGAENSVASFRSTPYFLLTFASNRTPVRDCPPRSKKLSWIPTRRCPATLSTSLSVASTSSFGLSDGVVVRLLTPPECHAV